MTTNPHITLLRRTPNQSRDEVYADIGGGLGDGTYVSGKVEVRRATWRHADKTTEPYLLVGVSTFRERIHVSADLDHVLWPYDGVDSGAHSTVADTLAAAAAMFEGEANSVRCLIEPADMRAQLCDNEYGFGEDYDRSSAVALLEFLDMAKRLRTAAHRPATEKAQAQIDADRAYADAVIARYAAEEEDDDETDA